jgi:acyl-CoA reductase-like NAD-dependent aldehyde dehydrogenase
VHNDIIACEEIWPVAGVIWFKDEADAIRIANDSDYGLAADYGRAMSAVRCVFRAASAGQVYVNEYQTSHDRNSFGGYKMSGWARKASRLTLPYASSASR